MAVAVEVAEAEATAAAGPVAVMAGSGGGGGRGWGGGGGKHFGSMPDRGGQASTCGGTGYENGYPTHSRVAELQRRLARAGYYSGAIDGIMGPATRRAINAYEREHGFAG